jgi:SAM-dependent methyltransferase
MTYTFEPITNCEMCGHDQFKIIGKRLNTSQGKTPTKKTGITTTVVKCKNCGLVFSNPLPVPANIQDHYGVPPETYWTEDYFKITGNEFKSEINFLRKHKPTGKALDIGAGIGKTMIALKDAGYDSYGFEPSIPFYDRAVSRMGVPRDRIQNAAIETIEYPENEFDFISFGAVLEHVYHPAAALKKAVKWLKPGGVIFIEVPSADWMINKMLNAFYKLKGSDYCANISPMHPPYHLYEFALKSFEENGKELGYSVIHHEYFVCNTYAPKPFDKILSSYMRKTNKGMDIAVWLRKD